MIDTNSEQNELLSQSSDSTAPSDEEQRAADLLRLAQAGERTILDAGARGGYFSRKLADLSRQVTALDLDLPSIDHAGVECVKGDITDLQLPDCSFDLVLCAEVLEHVPPNKLQRACCELARVSRRFVLIGVPFKQDIRVGRTTCAFCGHINPPWGHVNSFDERKLVRLFSRLSVVEKSFIGMSKDATNFLSTRMMDLAGNPYGTYQQDESCVSCGKHVGSAKARTFTQKVLTEMAFATRSATELFTRSHPAWIHLLFEKKQGL